MPTECIDSGLFYFYTELREDWVNRLQERISCGT